MDGKIAELVSATATVQIGSSLLAPLCNRLPEVVVRLPDKRYHSPMATLTVMRNITAHAPIERHSR